jgi:hypothetical protein
MMQRHNRHNRYNRPGYFKIILFLFQKKGIHFIFKIASLFFHSAQLRPAGVFVDNGGGNIFFSE